MEFLEIRGNLMLDTIRFLSSFENRFYLNDTGVQAAQWLADQGEVLAAGRADVTVELVQHNDSLRPSVVLTIAGQISPEEIVIIRGHVDSSQRSFLPFAHAPGADDNASGIATIKEVIRAALTFNWQPDRAASIYLAPGMKVVLFQHRQFHGRSVVLDGSEPDLARTVLGTGQVSSLRFLWGGGRASGGL